MNGGAAAKTIGELKPFVGDWKGLTFSSNQNGERVPLPSHVQQERFTKLVEQMAADGDWKQKDGQKKDEKELEKERNESIYRKFLRMVREAREFCLKRAADGHPLDEIGLRPLENGLLMLEAGIPLEAVLDAMTMHWPKEARSHFSIKQYDVKKFAPKERQPGVHAAMPYVKRLAAARIPIALVGPKGTGKTTLAGQLAKDLGLEFGFVSMTGGTSPSAFNGRPKIGGDGGIVPSVWERVYSQGGVFLMDEMDAADENLLMMVNAALANGFFSNTATGEIIQQHEDFIPIAGMNTLGLGSGRDYTGRNKLDAASLDRWNMGRVRIDLDSRIEEVLVERVESRTATESE